jgi:Spy/CpxP family protein refolding chaperone
MSRITNSFRTLTVAGALLFVGAAVAQTSTPSPTQPAPAAPGAGAGAGQVDPSHPRVNEVNRRLDNQQDRIKQGLKNGTLTQQQANQLWKHDRAVTNQEKKDMAAHGGHLTKAEQNQINRELNNNSKRIYKEKHQ